MALKKFGVVAVIFVFELEFRKINLVVLEPDTFLDPAKSVGPCTQVLAKNSWNGGTVVARDCVGNLA